MTVLRTLVGTRDRFFRVRSVDHGFEVASQLFSDYEIWTSQPNTEQVEIYAVVKGEQILVAVIEPG